MTARSILSVRDLTVEFRLTTGTLRAVDDVSFDVAMGERLAIVGESGSGKTTLALALLALVERPGRIVAGSVCVDDVELTALSERQLEDVRGRRIGLVFQDAQSALDPTFTVGSQLVETIRRHDSGANRRTARDRACELLAGVGVPDPRATLDRYPHQLSGGQRQRVMIAAALAPAPSVLVCDEPTTALDVTVQAQILALLDSLARERGTAVVLITHDFGIVAEFADRVLVMYAGRAAEIGSAADVFRSPAHPYTNGLLASSPRLDTELSEELFSIPGAPPDLLRLTGGCAFAPRCPYATTRCQAHAPALEPAQNGGGGHRVACYFPVGGRA